MARPETSIQLSLADTLTSGKAVKRFSDTICGAKPRAQTQALVVVSTTFLVIMIVCVLMRTVARVLNCNYGLDDLATSLSMVGHRNSTIERPNYRD
jgi:hypothetical protein